MAEPEVSRRGGVDMIGGEWNMAQIEANEREKARDENRRADRDECPGEHTINKTDDGDYWISCDGETIASATFDARIHVPSDIENWQYRVIEHHRVVFLRRALHTLRGAVWRIVNEVDECNHVTTEGGDRFMLTDVEAQSVRDALAAMEPF